MSKTAPTINLSVDWMDSPMLVDQPADVKLAWICLLCYAKSFGDKGKVRLDSKKMEMMFSLQKLVVFRVVELAKEHGAIEMDGPVATFVNWRHYQSKRRQPAAAKCDASEDAKRIYELYPRKVRRPDALKAIDAAIRRLMSREDDAMAKYGSCDGRWSWAGASAWLQGRVESFAKSDIGRGAKQFIPHCATWMNQDRFDEDESEWKREGSKELSEAMKHLMGETA